MRALIFELRPEVLEQEGLSAALAKQLEALEIRHKLKTEFAVGSEPDLPFGIKQALFRIVQEALHNVVKHAHADTVKLSLEQRNGEVHLNVSDNGVGFDTEQIFSGRLGLKSMRERAVSLGGSFDLISTPGASTAGQTGTRMQIVVPQGADTLKLSNTAILATPRPDAAEPNSSKSGTSKPDTSKPDTSKPDTSKPDTLAAGYEPELSSAERAEDTL